MKKTKVLIFGLTSLIGGVETYVINLVKNLDKEKFEIDFLVQDEITGINKEKIEGCYNKIFKVENFKKHPIKAMKTLKKICEENNYDVIHLNISTASSSLYALPSKLYFKNTKILVHSHNGGDKNKLQHYIFRIFSNRIADKYLACSELASNWMFGKKLTKSGKVIITNNFIETEKFIFNEEKRNKIREELGIKDEFVIGHVGRFNAQKNHLGMIEMLKDILKEEKDIKLMLLGSGELLEEVKEKVKEYKIENKVLFLGVKSNVNEFYQAMDLFILPSIFEGLPIVGIEAQASGLKCLFSANVTEESNITKNVEFYKLENKDEWIKEILKIKTKGYERENMKIKIKEAGYDLNEEIEKIEKIYQHEEEKWNKA